MHVVGVYMEDSAVECLIFALRKLENLCTHAQVCHHYNYLPMSFQSHVGGGKAMSTSCASFVIMYSGLNCIIYS